MKRYSWIGSAGLAMLLVGCGGSSTSNTNSFVLQAGEDGTGLPFADELGSLTLEDLEAGDTFRVRVVQYRNVEGSTEVSVVTTTEDVTLVDDGSGGFDFEMTLNGEEVLFEGDGTLPFGSDAEGTFEAGDLVELAIIERGDFSALFNGYAYPNFDREPRDGALNTDLFFVVGFATSPEAVEMMTGTAIYTGDLEGYGAVVDSDGALVQLESEIQGTLALNVSFDAMTIDGTITNGNTDAFGEFTGEMAPVDIAGNSFEGGFTVECVTFSCESASELGGSFYGPNGEDVSGLVSVDITGTDPDTEVATRLLGVGGFVTQPPE